MMFIPSTFLFIVVLLVSIVLVISSPTWLGAWLGLEVNLMSFIPLILNRRSLVSSECCMKYFLVQAFSSLLFLLSLILMMGDGPSLWLGGNVSLFGLMCALLIKLGAAPFHYWFPAVASGIGWTENFILMTMQKVAPIVLFSYLSMYSWELLIVVIMSTYVGSVGGINQMSLRKLMAFSSINHLGWMISSSLLGFKYLFMYFLLYSITNFVLVVCMNQMMVFYVSQLYYYSNNTLNMMLFYFNWLSFGGLPPFIGFLPKWVLIEGLVSSGYYFLTLFMVFMSLVSLFYYTRISYTMMTQSSVLSLVSGAELTISWSFILTLTMFLLSLLFVPLVILFL